MFGIGKSAEERRKEKERKKRGARKYGQASYKHSKMGIVSLITGIVSLGLIFSCILYAYLARGEAAGIVGGIIIISLIFAVYGIRAAIRGFSERERNYLTCKIGLPVNSAAVILFLAIFIGGLK